MPRDAAMARARRAPADAGRVPVRDADRTRTAILAAATEEFSAHGLSGARVDRIATRAKSNKRMLYYYFGGKEALYLAVLEGAYERIRTAERDLFSVPSTGGALRTLQLVLALGLVLALLRGDLEVTLLEPRARSWAFLREAARASARRVLVLRQRHDGYSGPPARTVTLRAVALPVDELAGLVAPGGRVVVFGGRPQAAGPFAATGEGEGLSGGVSVFRRLG